MLRLGFDSDLYFDLYFTSYSCRSWGFLLLPILFSFLVWGLGSILCSIPYGIAFAFVGYIKYTSRTGFFVSSFRFFIEFSPRPLRESSPCTCALVPRPPARRLIFEVSYIQCLTAGAPARSSSSVFSGGTVKGK